MTTPGPIVLVHGAFQTAGTWDLVAPRLEEAGRTAVVAELSGLEHTSPLSPSVTLDTHVRDLVSLIESRNLRDVFLVGHSYAGMIITGAAEDAHSRIAELVYVDALVPEHGQSAMELFPARTRDNFRRLAEQADGWRIPAGDHLLDLWGLEEGEARAFVRARLSDFPIACFEQPLNAPTNGARSIPRAYISCVKEGYPARGVFAPFAARASREGWPYDELPTGHDCQAEMPDALCAMLLRLREIPTRG